MLTDLGVSAREADAPVRHDLLVARIQSDKHQAEGGGVARSSLMQLRSPCAASGGK